MIGNAGGLSAKAPGKGPETREGHSEKGDTRSGIRNVAVERAGGGAAIDVDAHVGLSL